MTKGYYTTKQLTERFSCSSRTLFRWMNKDANPFPQPRLRPSGSHNLWAIEDVDAWEEQEAARTAA
ncbi:helix-turn-helix transcriptional regulator [Alcanivorax sp. IL3]|jgi:predicted DNA-binding transcriptional regulator AlpA|uniref:helix-turn-helix transcriptional regulator n=1 Tax=unclassified Alcanivorax TaxID=2638842 RepID=UPI0039C3AAF1